MTFLHPWAIWAGVAAAAIPIAVHLLTRPRPTRLPLSTLRFVREALRQRRARHVLRDFLILALRTLAILAAALAIARPQFGTRPLVSERQSGDTVRVVLLDASQSMAATDHGIQLMERARARAAEQLRYRPGLWADLVVAGVAPRAVFEQPSTNFDALRDVLDRSVALPQRLDVRRAIGKAAQLLAPTSDDDNRRRELVVVSDFQRSSWASADFSPLPEGTQIQLESAAPPEPLGNLAILRAECQVRGAGARSGQLNIEVGNYTAAAAAVTVEVSLSKASWRLAGTCPAGRSVTLTEEIPLREVGWHWGEARLVGVDDALPADNVRPLVVRVRPPPVYAMLTRQGPRERPSSSHFLESALVPEGRSGQKKADVGAVVRIDPAGVTAPSLAAADLIVLDHPGKLSAEAVGLVHGLLRRGRPVLYVASELVDAVNLKQLAEKAGSGLQMPVEFSPPPQGQFRRDLFLASWRRDDVPFRIFGDSADAAVGRLRFSGGLSSRRLPETLDEEVLGTYNDGTAAMVIAPLGEGTLSVINADLAASNLPRAPAFVPLVSELVDRLLDHNRARESAACGEQFVVNLPGEAGIAAGLRVASVPLAPPVSADAASESCGEIVDEGSGVAWRWSSPPRPGVYRVQRGTQTVFALAVQIPAEESQLQSISPDVLKTRLAAGHNVYYRDAAAESDPRDDAWTWFAVACVICLLGELVALLGFRT
jgi:hypothetical protein